MEVREPAIAYGKQKMSIAEYLEMENSSLEKHEYYKGEVLTMAGAKVPHNIIASNLMIALGQKLKVNLVVHSTATYVFMSKRIRFLLILTFLSFVVR